MPKIIAFTTITPLPLGITRSSVIDMYHDHVAMIDLNPLVVDRFKCRPPSYAPANECYSTWYTIKDKVSYLPGGLATGSVSYHASFQDLHDGLQTHVYAPLSLGIEAKWSVGGSLPGEPRLPVESGLQAPLVGLYIREDVKMTCSSLLMSFVKKTFKDSHARLVETLVERAQALESNLENSRLNQSRNVDPGERMGHGDIFIAPPPDYVLHTPTARFLSVHSRSHSEPVLSPGLCQPSSLTEHSEYVSALIDSYDRPISFQFSTDDIARAELSPFLLPSTTYSNGFSKRHERPASLYPGSQFHQVSNEILAKSLVSPVKEKRPVTRRGPTRRPSDFSRRPSDQPIAIHSPFDTTVSTKELAIAETRHAKQTKVFNDIDDAIEEVFMITLAATRFGEAPPPPKYEEPQLLPSTTYVPNRTRQDSMASTSNHSRKGSAAPTPRLRQDSAIPTPKLRQNSVTHTPKLQSRKESTATIKVRQNFVVPATQYSDTNLPPVPAKDEKYKKSR